MSIYKRTQIYLPEDTLRELKSRAEEGTPDGTMIIKKSMNTHMLVPGGTIAGGTNGNC
jgi:hypothetical protein